MSSTHVAILGAIAGFTIYLGLPLGRVRGLSVRTRGILSMLAAGILLFIFWDVLTASHDILEGSLAQAKAGDGWDTFVAQFLMAAVGFAVGAFGLAWLERTVMRLRPRPPMAGGSAEAAVIGGGVPRTADLAADARRASLTMGMLIAGVAIHNATEGFGIVGPLNGIIPSWKWIGLAGLIGGGPTFVGTLVGYQVSSPALEICFYTLAAGAILYVVGQLWTTAQRKLSTDLILAALVVGYLIGLSSDLIITYGGG